MARVVDTFFYNASDTHSIPLTVATRFLPILYMLNQPDTQLSYLTASSLKGFMVILDCPQDTGQYTELFSNKRIDTYLLKLVVITPQVNTHLADFDDIGNINPNSVDGLWSKDSESETSFIAEGQLQQQLNLNNNIGHHVEFIPPVLSFGLFTNSVSKKMLRLLLNKSTTGGANGSSTHIFNYLLSTINSNIDYKIGILVMPMLDRSEPLGPYLHGLHRSRSPNYQNQYEIRMAQLVSNVVNLLLFMRTIHMDLHLKNALRVDRKLYLIDFGSASDLKLGSGDEYFKAKKDTPQKTSKYSMEQVAGSFYLEFTENRGKLNSQQKAEFMEKVVNWVWEQEVKGNKGLYGILPPNPPFSQMQHWVPQLTPAIYEAAYDNLVTNTTDQPGAVKYSEIIKKNCFNFGAVDNSDYYVTIPQYIKGVEITENPQAQQQQAQQQQPQSNTNYTIAVLLGLLAVCGYFYLKPKTGGSKPIMFGGEESSIEEIRAYIKDNQLENMLLEMEQTKTCPIGKNAEHARKLYEMLSSVPQEKQSEVILYPNEIQDAGRGKRRRSRKIRKAKKTRKIRRTNKAKKQRKTRRM